MFKRIKQKLTVSNMQPWAWFTILWLGSLFAFVLMTYSMKMVLKLAFTLT